MSIEIPLPETAETNAKVNEILTKVLPMVREEHPIVHGLVAAELTIQWLMRHPPDIRPQLLSLQFDATLDLLVEEHNKEKGNG